MDGTLWSLLLIIQAYGEVLCQPRKFFSRSKKTDWHGRANSLLACHLGREQISSRPSLQISIGVIRICRAFVSSYNAMIGGQLVWVLFLKVMLQRRRRVNFTLTSSQWCIQKGVVGTTDGSFSVASFFITVTGGSQDLNTISFLWKQKLLRGPTFWLVGNIRRYPRYGNLQRLKMITENAFSTCFDDAESVDH